MGYQENGQAAAETFGGAWILSGSLKAVHENGGAVCTIGPASLRNAKPANRTGLTFRAVLTEDGAQRVKLDRA
jgi:hypothetical protein